MRPRWCPCERRSGRADRLVVVGLCADRWHWHTAPVQPQQPLGDHDQHRHRVRFDWGRTGAVEVPADVAVVVDVLSFTTTLTIAVDKGIEVFPHPTRGTSAKQAALRHGAALAVGRVEALTRQDARHVSLSPASMLRAEGIERLVLPSPNGSALSSTLAEQGEQVVGASIRNAPAVAAHLASVLGDRGSVVVLAAGERWPDDTLRPAVEDLWGAGAVIAALADHLGPAALSPEAHVAAAAFAAVRDDLPAQLAGCASGVELVNRGFAEDVSIAAEHGVCSAVPVLSGESFTPAPVGRPRLRLQ